MDFAAPKLNVQDLQTEVIDLLGQISALMGQASVAISVDGAGEKYGKFQQEVAQAARSVEDLELRMAIVAPMKAGKSTIINAIIGQELLPSRNAAMTTIPTEIVFDANLKEPKLTLSPETSKVFQETFFALQQKIRELGNERVREKIAQYPHLAKLLLGIQAKTGGSIDEEITGRQRIINNLGALNDIIRLCHLLDPLAEPIDSLTDVPRIHTPFWRFQKAEQSNLLGNLVIVDTPGPNEAGDHKLGNVVAQQLRESSLVLIVLNFTALNTKAEAEVKMDVLTVIELRGKDNLYVLVNKVDQRKDGDMTPEQVRQFVVAEFGIGDGNTNRVFEISARWAFSATNFLAELQQRPGVELREMKTARSLAQDLFPIDWEEELQEATVQELKIKAEKLWKKSGFAPFLEKAINALMAEAAPRCMMSALNTARSRLAELRGDLQLRSSAIGEHEKKLRAEIVALEADLESLESCRMQLMEVETIRVKLQQNINEILEDLKKQAKVSVETYFLQEEYQQAEADNTMSSHLKKMDMEGREFFLKKLAEFEIFPKWLSQRIKSVFEYKSSGILKFNRAGDAQDFANLAAIYAKQRAEILLYEAEKITLGQIEQARNDLRNVLENESMYIIQNACQRLHETFHIDLSLPQPVLQGDDKIDYIPPKVRRQTKEITEYKKKKYKPFYFLWLVEVEKEFSVIRQEEYYTISLEQVVANVNRSIEQSIANINTKIHQYLDEDFQQRVDAFFKNLENYLSNYRDSLVQAQQNQQLSLEQKEKLVVELNSLVSSATESIKKADSYLEYTTVLMADK